jgi:hypothetical protein
MSVTVVAVLLLVEALLGLFWIVTIYTSPEMHSYIQETTNSLSAYVFLIFVNAGLSIRCGIGLLNGRNWARMLYIGFVPILISLAIINGFKITMLIGLAQYIIFAIILARPNASDYFHREHSSNC